LAALERIHLRRIGALFVLVVERGTDAIAYQTTEDATDRGAGKTIAGSATRNRRTYQRARASADQSAGVFSRSRPDSIGASRTSSERQSDDRDGEKFRRGHFDPRICGINKPA
jgi:hypothetical protein